MIGYDKLNMDSVNLRIITGKKIKCGSRDNNPIKKTEYSSNSNLKISNSKITQPITRHRIGVGWLRETNYDGRETKQIETWWY